jgi:hypothetical protein
VRVRVGCCYLYGVCAATMSKMDLACLYNFHLGVLPPLKWVPGLFPGGKAADEAMPWLRRLVSGLSPRRPGLDPGSFHVGFVVDKVALGQVFLRVLRFYPVNFIPPVLNQN